MSTKLKYGCCPNPATKDSLECAECRLMYHHGCIERRSKSASLFKDLSQEFKNSWVCPTCVSKKPKINLVDTPVRGSLDAELTNITYRKKAQSVVDPPQHSVTDLRLIMREEMSSLLDDFKANILHQIDLQTGEILNRVTKVDETLISLQRKYEAVKMDLDVKTKAITCLESENSELKCLVTSLNGRLSQVEQHSRSCNVEIQCIPEFKAENLFKTVKQMTQVINCNVNEVDIHLCTRVSKLNKDSKRPRSTIVKFSCPRVRDEFLSAAIAFNKKAATNADKLNSSHLGIAGDRRPIFVCEHLSPTMKNIHAAARAKAKELNYKFVWVKGGNIYMRKNESAQYVLIKSIECLSKLN